jgi:hypothetical protein
VSGARQTARQDPFVELWSVPTGNGLLMGARSAEAGARKTFRVTLFRAASRLRTWRFSLSWGQSWQVFVPLPRAHAVYRTILMDDHGAQMHALRVTLPAGTKGA